MWHRAGTITVTKGNKAVTGVATAWVQNIRAGDALQGPDGRNYEVTNVASDTALSIEPAYMGNTASGQWYQILPILGQQKRLADRAAELVGVVGLLPGEVASNEHRIANAEQAMLAKIGNLAGLQNLKQSQLNLGVIQSLVGEVFSTDNCVVLENSHGLAYRHPHGLQVCHCEAMIEMRPNVWEAYEWTYPAPFLSGGVTVPLASPYSAVPQAFGEPWVFGNQSATGAILRMKRIDSTATTIKLFSIGRWKK